MWSLSGAAGSPAAIAAGCLSAAIAVLVQDKEGICFKRREEEEDRGLVDGDEADWPMQGGGRSQAACGSGVVFFHLAALG